MYLTTQLRHGEVTVWLLELFSSSYAVGTRAAGIPPSERRYMSPEFVRGRENHPLETSSM